MTLDSAYDFFESLESKTIKKSEIKVYEKFLHILKGLKTREFSKDEIESIEAELDRLNLESNPENRKRHVTKALSTFEKFLKDTFTLTTKAYYTNMGVALGSSFGLLFGVAILSSLERSLGISLGLMGGMFIGLTIGRSLEAKAIAEGRVL